MSSDIGRWRFSLAAAAVVLQISAIAWQQATPPPRDAPQPPPTGTAVISGRVVTGDPTPAPVRHAACMYTMSPDGHFILGRHPQHDSVCFAAGFSGHGFKFAPLIGAVMDDLAIDGRTDEPIRFLALSRPALSGS